MGTSRVYTVVQLQGMMKAKEDSFSQEQNAEMRALNHQTMQLETKPTSQPSGATTATPSANG